MNDENQISIKGLDGVVEIPSAPPSPSTSAAERGKKKRRVSRGRKARVKRGEKTGYAGITKNADGSYKVRVVIKEGGQRRERESTIKGTLEDALEEQQKLRATSTMPATTPVQEVPDAIDKLMDVWMERKSQLEKWRTDTKEKHQQNARIHILPYFQKASVLNLKPRDLESWQIWMVQRKQPNGKRYSKHTLHCAWRSLMSFLTWAVSYLDLPKNPALGVKYEGGGEPSKKKDSLTQEELSKLIAETKHESVDIAAMILTAATTGMRFGEISALEWSDVDFSTNTIHVRRSQVEGSVGLTKTSTARTVPLTPVLRKALENIRALQQSGSLAKMGDVIFPSREGTYRYNSCLRKPLAACCKRAGITKHVSSHTFRRTVNNLVRKAAGDIAARAIVGHSTEEMTDLYSHVDYEEKAKALEAITLGIRGGAPTTDGGATH